jgi:hypothetical protein
MALRYVFMGLRSRLFAGDAKLEAAAVSDPAHIVQGARGEHVRKIQLALIRLDGAQIDQDGLYGPDTAGKVLAYKQKRKIVNRGVQAVADDIVGKMTMAALDSEMLADEAKPVLIRPLFPAPRSALGPRRGGGLLLAFGVGDGGASSKPVPSSQPAGRAAAPVVAQVIITPNGTGTIQVVGGRGGSLVRFQVEVRGSPTGIFPIAKLRNAKVPGTGAEDVAIVADPEIFNYDGNLCGETFFQWFGPEPQNKRSGVLSVLVLVRRANTTPEAEFPPSKSLKSGLVSVEGTPLKPLPGRKINLFGRGESSGFEDYSSDLPFCSDQTFHRPWTDDPRKPDIGIPERSVKNICCRGSPIGDVTIAEIKRIGAPGCRVTFSGDLKFANRLRSEFVDRGLAGPPLDEGPSGSGHVAIVFELK